MRGDVKEDKPTCINDYIIGECIFVMNNRIKKAVYLNLRDMAKIWSQFLNLNFCGVNFFKKSGKIVAQIWESR